MSDNGSDVKSILRDFVKNNFLYSTDINEVLDDTSFTDNSIIDSTGVLELIDFLEDRFEISIENDEVIPENLDSFNKLEVFINNKKN